ncbi:MAG: hypothetical protein K8E66_02220, partial [Phycisphaerales bacterium]|nr:hypothetical protein [Phycisphaerales bacterium]
GQPLKSFRDRAVDFAVYDRASGVASYLDTLGPLEKMARGSKAGLAFGGHPPIVLAPSEIAEQAAGVDLQPAAEAPSIPESPPAAGGA